MPEACSRCPISILIPTKNESSNLRKCLEGVVGWASEIVIVDSASSDGTLEIAEQFGANRPPIRICWGVA